MDLEEIDIVIEQDGRVRIEVRGVKGPDCLSLTENLERTLGGHVLSREMTPEANDPIVNRDPDRQQAQ